MAGEAPRRASGSEKEGDRPVIDQSNAHMGPKPAAFHPSRMQIPTNSKKSVEAGFSLVRRSGGREAGPHAGAGIGRQGELADQQQATAGVLEREVHAVLRVAEDAIAQEALGHPLDLRRRVPGFHADEREQAGVDGADDLPFDFDAGGGDALDQGEHGGPGGRGRRDDRIAV